MAETKKKAAAEKKKPMPAGRDEAGRFIKGVSGNPRGRAPLPEGFSDYAKQSPEKLWELVNDELTPAKVKADVLRWFAEMYYGKSPQALDIDGKLEGGGVQTIRFEGKLEDWAK